jgi:hypothetical protein
VTVIERITSFAERYARAASLVAYTFSLGVITRRGRRLISQLARAANYRPVPLTIPTVAADDVTTPSTPIVLPYPDGVDGNVGMLELIVLARIVRERDPQEVFEIGTFNGRSTATLAANTGDQTTIFTLDLPRAQAPSLSLTPAERAFVEKESSGDVFLASAYMPKVRQLYGDSATFDFSPFTADVVFVDGSHAYEYVVNDSGRALSMLRKGRGVILWHDYGEWEGVTRALNELYGSDSRFARLKHVQGTSLVLLEV